jgi:hypothetical protein
MTEIMAANFRVKDQSCSMRRSSVTALTHHFVHHARVHHLATKQVNHARQVQLVLIGSNVDHCLLEPTFFRAKRYDDDFHFFSKT